MSEPELRECPFCGESGTLTLRQSLEAPVMSTIGCGDCGSGGPMENSGREAITAWNRRVVPLSAEIHVKREEPE